MSFALKTTTRALEAWKSDIAVVPHSGLQMLDFGFNLDETDFRLSFLERDVADEGARERMLVPLTGPTERNRALEADAEGSDPLRYSIDARAAMEPFLSKWVPVPVLRIKKESGPGDERYDPGPSTWARLRVVELDERDPDTGHTHRIQLALDTGVVPDESGDETLRYLAPRRADVVNPREFRFVSDPGKMSWFLRRVEQAGAGDPVDLQSWVSDWILELFVAFLQAQDPDRPVNLEKRKKRFEHWSRYLAFLGLIDAVANLPKLRLADTMSERDAQRPVEVDLVLDVGNSRTCGILIEREPDSVQVKLSNSYPLRMRDLSKPELHYSGLFESRVEFADVAFGNERLAGRSGRRNAFLWPSFVRVGPEAMRLVESEEGTETKSGLSSPKRYLWDQAPTGRDWRFHGHSDDNNLPRTVRAAMFHLNEAGEMIAQVKDEIAQKLRSPVGALLTRGSRPRFSRSSLFSFLLAEIFAHALIQVNDPANRARRHDSDLPRRLSRIILTIPTATPIQEQALIRSHAAAALRLVWAQFGIEGTDSTISAPPDLVIDWDEASCTQLVYLFSEITQKFEGRIEDYFTLAGRPRSREQGQPPEPSCQIACIDIGGGTTDLMITRYFRRSDRVLEPTQVFREGFRIAGDDLTQRIVTSLVLPALTDAITEAGGRHVSERMTELFGGDKGDQDTQTKRRRQQFGLRVLAPLAVALFSAGNGQGADVTVTAADLFGLETVEDPHRDEEAPPRTRLALPAELTSYLEDAARERGAEGWSLKDFVLVISPDAIETVVRETFQGVLSNMCEVIDHVGCDAVLLTGRPSQHGAVRRIVEEMLVVPPDRLVSMHSYRTDAWYPFRDPVTHRIGDPKSTVAMGGMLLALAAGKIANFKVDTRDYRMRSTATYVGEMEGTGQIRAGRVFFRNDDTDPRARRQPAEIQMDTPMHIGSRQLDLERWTTTPLYRLDYANASAHRLPQPLHLRLERVEIDDDDLGESTDGKLRSEALREAFTVTEVRDGEGNDVPEDVVTLKLHTMGFEDEYWLDTGVFRI